MQDEQFGGYRANIVTYTLAYLTHKTAQRIDLDTVWRDQKVSAILQDAIRVISRKVHQVIVDPPAGGNVTEWCKKEACWRRVRELDIELPPELEETLLGQAVPRQIDLGIEGPDLADQQLIEQVAKISADVWFQISSWAKDTSNLQPWQRSLAVSLGRLATANKSPSRKQAAQGSKILKEAERLGFRLAVLV